MNNKYDVIIAGGGQTGVFASLELIKNNKDLKILVIEKGNHLSKRNCPNITHGKCVKCKVCSISSGLGGSGSYSDSKLSLSPDVGGNIKNYIGYDKTQELINYIDKIYTSFGADATINWDNDNEIIKQIDEQATKHNMRLINCPVRHLGTEKSLEIYTKIIKYLEDNGVEFLCNTEVKDIIFKDKNVKGVICSKDYTVNTYHADKVVLCMGRSGSSKIQEICKMNNISSTVGMIDIGVRVECSDEIMKVINENLYEGKFIYNTKNGNSVRTFCSNPSGYVTREKYNTPIGNIYTVNGHSYKEKHSENTNFALLVSKQIEGLENPIEYGENIVRLANILSGDSVIVQRYGDFKRCRKTTEGDLKNNEVRPSLKDCKNGDLSLCLPYQIMEDIIEMIENLNNITPNINSDGTLLYGVEVKFNFGTPDISDNFESKDIKGLYFGGDGAGLTRGLMQAGINGIVISRDILKNIK